MKNHLVFEPYQHTEALICDFQHCHSVAMFYMLQLDKITESSNTGRGKENEERLKQEQQVSLMMTSARPD